MKVKIITDSKELEEFTSREDISISKIDIEPCDQNFFAQEWFIAVVMYEENVSANNFDWQSFRAEAVKDILSKLITIGTYDSQNFGSISKPDYRKIFVPCYTKECAVTKAIEIADELVKQLKRKGEK